jgi:hypothetical protein
MAAFSTLTPFLGTGALGAVGLAAKKAVSSKQCNDYSKGKEKHLRVPKGYEAYKLRFGFPVTRGEEPVVLREGQILRLFGLETLRYVNKLPQMHSIPDVNVVLQNGISFKATPYLGYSISDGFAAEFGVADWKKYLVDKATALLNSKLGKVDEISAFDEEAEDLVVELNKQVEVCGIKVDFIGFKDVVTDEIGRTILGQYALGNERVKVLGEAEKKLGGSEGLDPLIAIAILGGPFMATGAASGSGIIPGRSADLTVLHGGENAIEA